MVAKMSNFYIVITNVVFRKMLCGTNVSGIKVTALLLAVLHPLTLWARVFL